MLKEPLPAFCDAKNRSRRREASGMGQRAWKKHLVDHIADRNLCDDFQHSAPVQPRDAQAKRPGQVICSSNLALLYSKPRVLFTVGSHQLAEASPL